MKTISKAKQKLRERFAAAAVEAIRRHYGTPTDEARREYTMPTKYGPLRLHVVSDFGDIGTVFMQFDNDALAAPYTGCSQPSGKWNHHYFHWDLAAAVDDLRRALGRVAIATVESVT